MVSSKCFQVESPSPLRFLAALMPPCAHTECERLTGTMENRSTCPPISAILMTAESPASPPPTTMMRGAAMLSCPLHYRMARGNIAGHTRKILETRVEGVEAGNADHGQNHEECQAEAEQSLLRLVANHNPPLCAEQPDAVSEVPRGRDQTDYVERQQPGVVNFRRHLAKRCNGIVVQVRAAEAHGVGVPDDVDEGNPAAPALHAVHPVA